MKATLCARELHPRHAFRIARPRTRPLRNVYLRIEGGGAVGYGEASPNAYYQETAEGVEARLAGAAEFIERLAPESPAEIERLWEESWGWLQPSRAAQCALDLALWDWLARRRGVSVAELVWGEKPQPVVSFGTIGLSQPAELPVKLEELRGFARIKVKVDRSADLTTLRAVRAQSSALVAVDANADWAAPQLLRMSTELAALGVAFLEQPLPPSNDESLLLHGYPLPVMADESCVVAPDVERIARHFDGFNIKLVKCGGLTPGLRMLQRGRELGCRVMIGCMLESSLLIAAGAVLGQQTEFADLDGAWLLADDPFTGLPLVGGVLRPAGLGLGVEPEPSLFGA